MSAEKPVATSSGHETPSSAPSLRATIRSSREFLCRTLTTARAHSPLSDDKLEAADDAVSGVIHTGYQAVKRVIQNGHPAVILTAAGIAAAAPSFPFGPQAIVRNVGLTLTLTAVMIYPDHLKTKPAPSSSRSEMNR
ncbi:unnamed protein product [Chondrus crispus]|uniref:Uncharacterized protein n=1 Tax=Chondrus crispus TaxID=2769 RepID=R7QEQ4_CHOCR|nr:unnamed protein product [Chondrus crispus]CDF36268.1 unnamed protein product [Chondrus crispus]|eukprot:XP_005716087.1 unnamed protein product [Chondrus crispus]